MQGISSARAGSPAPVRAPLEFSNGTKVELRADNSVKVTTADGNIQRLDAEKGRQFLNELVSVGHAVDPSSKLLTSDFAMEQLAARQADPTVAAQVAPALQ